MNRSVEFFDSQFRRQAEKAEYVLNPFELAVLPYLKGEVLDLGCGLGNLAMAAARAGCVVTALDASPGGIADLARRAAAEGASVQAGGAELSRFRAVRRYDAVACIGLLMFFGCGDARLVLGEILRSVRPGGIAAVNVLVQGTTYMAMFDPAAHCLFADKELEVAAKGWEILVSRHEDFPAPEGTIKRFHTVIARSPIGPDLDEST